MRRNFLRGLIIILAALALTFWGRALKRDVDLTAAPVGSGEKLDWELGGVTAVRNIGKDQWKISAEKVVRDHPVEKLIDVSAQITGPSGLRTINAPAGVYDQKNGALTLCDVDGTWQRSEHPFTWKTPKALWEQKSDVWTFPKGVAVNGDVYALTCKSAVMDGQRKVFLEYGCIRWWSE